MSSDISINVADITKAYALFAHPADRLKQMVVPRLRRALFLEPKRYYNEFHALKGISFDVKRGETVGIIGRNGSGKSTLLQIICGTLQATSGHVTTQGRICALLELGAGFNPDFSGIENVRLSGQLLGLTRREIEEALPAIADFAEIGDFIHHPVKTYSSGMFVRLAFATQAFVNPDILVIDEALAVGDARFQAKCLTRLESLRASGTSILFVSHDPGSVRRFCDRALWIDQGEMKALGDVAEVTSAYMEFLFAKPVQSQPVQPYGAEKSGPEPQGQKTGQETPKPVAEGSQTLPRLLQWPAPAEMRLDTPHHRPLRRWGSHPGLIQAAVITDEAAKEEHHDRLIGTPLRVVVHTLLPESAPRDTMALAFALKNAKGLDLVIRSTWDDPACRFSEGARSAIITFTLDNILNEGDYVLVVALEDRSSPDIHYYDFVEGAAYLHSRTLRHQWGLTVPPVTIGLEERKRV
jgi:lipopolysaccharide transport system ATP-binding protein